MPIYLGNKKISYQQHIDYNKDSGDTPVATGKKAVNFYDYEGTLLHSYTREEALGLSELPALPDRTSENLTCQGWNWTLSDIQSELTNREDLDYLAVGTNYITTDGATHINITMADKYRSQMPLRFKGNVTIDWGDGNTQTVNHTSAIIITHEYAITQSYPAKYTIKLTVNSGTLTFGDGSDDYNICGSITLTTRNPARAYSSRIDSVFIGNSVTSIGNSAFAQCYSLASVTIPNSVLNIGDYAFDGCVSLASITIPDGVTVIGTEAFDGCYSLASISIPSSVTSIGNNAFNKCSSLASFSIPNSVESIGSNSFYNCYSLASISIPSSVTSIGTMAFQSCYSLASISIPHSVSSINNNAFGYCSSLMSVTIPNSVSSIGNMAFGNCYSLASISIPSSVTSIGTQTFNYCYGIVKYDFSTHTTVPTLGNTSAFSNTTGDKQIVVPDALYDTWIAATNWSTYASYIIKASEYIEPQYVPPHTIITYTDGNTTEIEVGDDGILTAEMTKGAGNEYNTNTTIKSVEIGSDVTSIGDWAFSGCSSLTSITIPDSVTSIRYDAFNYCTSLTSITISKGVTSIWSYAFDGCSSLTSITLPSSVTSIESLAFRDCSSLTNIILENRTFSEAQSLIGTTNEIGYTGTVTYNGGTYNTVWNDPHAGDGN